MLTVRQSVRGPYRCVLVPVDFSPWSHEAVRLAVRIAPEATVLLMHAVEVPFERRMRSSGVSDKAIARSRAHARAEAEQKLAEFAAQTGVAPDRLRQATPQGDDPWLLIAQQEQEHDCDLIVMGRQGRHALEELMLGTTTSRVLAECSADVLVSTHTTLRP